MAQYINTNMASLNSQRSLNSSQSVLAVSLQRLSSGMRINSAKDDAAGMAISNRMTSQINGLAQGARNANDGISLAQTAEGAINEISNNLQRMRELSVQAANATNNSSDRISINNEIQQLSEEIQRVAISTRFNGTNLLDGTFIAQSFHVGPNQGEVISINSISNMQVAQLGTASTYQTTVAGGVTTAALNAGDLTLNGLQVPASQAGLAGQSTSSAFSIAAAINAISANSGVTATANSTSLSGASATNFGSVAANSFSINGVNVGAIAAGGNATGQGANVAAAINLISSQTGVTASANAVSGAVTLTAADGRDISIASAYGQEIAANATALNTTLAAKIGFPVGTGATTTATNAPVAGTNLAVAGFRTANASQGTIAANTYSITTASGTYALGAVDLTGTAAQNAANLTAAINTATGATVVTNVAGSPIYTAAIAYSIDVMGVASTAAVATANQVTGVAKFGTPSAAGVVGTQASVPLVATAAAAATTHGSVTLNSTSASGINIGGVAAASAGLTPGATAATLTSSVTSISSVNVLTAAAAQNAITAIDSALNTVNTARGALGSYQNRFASAIANLQTDAENLTASRSRIQDTDFAAETGQLARAQILQQAGTAMLAQANTVPNGVLALLR